MVSRNILSLNVAKTNCMIFGNNRFEENYMISINGMNIKRVYVTTFLVVYIDYKLNWNEHISVVKTKFAKNVSILNRVKHCLISSALYSLYCTLILPYLNYFGVILIKVEYIRYILCKKELSEFVEIQIIGLIQGQYFTSLILCVYPIW